MRRVLWVLLLLLGNGLLPASCVVHARRAQTQNTNFISKLKLFDWCQLLWNVFHVCLTLPYCYFWFHFLCFDMFRIQLL